MYHIGIIYVPCDIEKQRAIDIIKRAIDLKKYDIRVKLAADAAMPDIAASDIIIFASDSSSSNPINEDYSEIVRALKGINLSGRLAGIISFGTDDTAETWQNVLKCTGITCYEESLIITDTIDENNIRKWLKSLIRKYEVIVNGR